MCFLSVESRKNSDIIFPAENQQNVEEDILPEQMEGIHAHYVSSIEEVLDIALPQSPAEAREDAETREQVLADAEK
jgi:ATP-dependent Lon protease